MPDLGSLVGSHEPGFPPRLEGQDPQAPAADGGAEVLAVRGPGFDECLAGVGHQQTFLVCAVHRLAENMQEAALRGERHAAAVRRPDRSHIVRFGSGQRRIAATPDVVHPQITAPAVVGPAFEDNAPAVG